MLKLEDLCSDLVLCPEEHRLNGARLLEALNPIEQTFFDQYKSWWTCRSGYRTWERHVEIYREINAKRKAQKLPITPVPLGSKHLIFRAVDIADPLDQVKSFVAEHLHLFEEAGIYFEAFKYTKGWIHMQDAAPKSRNRFFIPF